MKEPVEYVPKALRVPVPEAVLPPAYAIGSVVWDGEIRLHAGPFPTLEPALETIGDDESARIVKLTGTGQQILYRWLDDRWVHV